MQQPNNNSDAVKRCMTVPIAPASSQLRFQPHPPFAAGHTNKQRPRPYSAPLARKSYTVPWHAPAYEEPRNPSRYYNVSLLNHTPLETSVSRHAPYAARKMESFINSALGYPRVEGGKVVPIPSYDPLNDPHLVEYFERRFGSIQTESLRRQKLFNAWSSSSSSPSTFGLLPKRRKLDKGSDILYKVAVTTGNVKNASTDAKVFIKLKGLRGKLPKTRLTKKAGSVKSGKKVPFRFTKGSTHIFKVWGPNIGEIKSLLVETSAIKMEEAWFLEQIEVVNTKSKKSYLFLCNQWLSLYHADGQVSRELFALRASKTEYEVVTVTGNKANAGTSANVFMTLYGKTGVTEKIHLKNNSKSLFTSGATDMFTFKSSCVGPMKKLRIEHDNQGSFPGWFLERVVVTDLKHPEWKYFFPCGQWLAKDEGDHEISRDLIGNRDPLAIKKPCQYKVTVYTGDKLGAGTDANVTLTMFGEFGDSGEKKLRKSKKNCFERKAIEEFILTCPKLGRLDRIRIGHDNSGPNAGWFLDKIIVDDVQAKTVYNFPCQRWLAKDEDDGAITRELYVNVGPRDMSKGFPFVVTVKTGNKSNAGTDARVYIIMHGGDKGADTSGKIWLDNGKFERNVTDIFNVDVAKMISPLSKLEIGHDDTGAAAGWYLESVLIYCPTTGIEQYFPCHQWLATDEGDGLIQRVLLEQKSMRKTKEKQITWQCWVTTSDIKNAGTDANVYICIYGDKSKTDDIPLDNKGDNFEQGQMDAFRFTTVEIGKPYKLRVWHDNAGSFPGWHLDKIELESMEGKERFVFVCGRWLAEGEDDKMTIRELPAESPSIKRPLPLVSYIVQVYTGNKSFAGTDANVYINIFGELGDTGNRPLKYSKTSKNKFEKGKMDEFEIEAVTLHKLKKIRIGHDGKGPGAGWFLDKVVIFCKEEKDKFGEVTFNCNRWLAEDKDDGLIEREITVGGTQMLSTTSYHVSVRTGDKKGAGTDANVFLKIFGTRGDTGILQLRQSENSSNKFEKGKTDLFKLEAEDIGKIKKIRIGHDNSKLGAAWYLEEVLIKVPSKGEHYSFACRKWLSDKEQTEVDLEPLVTQAVEKTIPYEVTIWTGTEKGAGTDANVFIQMYGDSGKTQEIPLDNKSDNFEKGQVDKFKIEAPDVGTLLKVRIGHDGAGMMSGWFLEKMLIQREASHKKSLKRKLSEQDRRKSILRSDEDSESPSSPGRRRSNFKGSRSQLEVLEEEDEHADTEDYWFFVNKWFSKSDGDKLIVRELIPTDEKGRPLKGALEELEYVVKVRTGDVRFAGTDANVYLTIYGANGDTGERYLEQSKTNINKFEQNQEDIFTIKAVDLGILNKVNIRHDNKGGGADWFLDSVEVEDTKNKKSYFFPCQRWLAVSKDDGQLSRDLMPVDQALKRKLSKKDSKTNIRDEIGLEVKAALTTYHVKVFTGDKFGAGTDANVYVILFGDKDSSNKLFLKSSMNNKNKFERNQMDEFILELANIGELKKIKIGHDNAGGGGAWFLDKVLIDAPSLGRAWLFPCGRWLSDSDDDRMIERELFPQELATEEYKPCIPYEITTYTSNISGAGTDAMVHIALYGKEVATQQKDLCSNKRECKAKFNKGSVDKFIVELEDVGDTIEKLRIGHDDSGFGAAWHLDKVEVRRLHDTGKGSITYTFPCGRWLAKNQEDGAIERELVPEKAVQELVGRDGETKAKELKIKEKLEAKKYTVEVYTGDVSGGGTDANVFLTMFGDKGDSGERQLRNSETNRDKFERKQMDRFIVEAVDLGNLYKIKIRHDNSMISPAWFLDRVEVIDGKDKYVFHCERWLAKNKDDGKIERTLYVKGYDGDMSSTGTLKSTRFGGSVASLESMRTTDGFSKSPRVTRKQLETLKEDDFKGPTIPYTIKVLTGDGSDNGTSSNVWVQIFGLKKKKTGQLFLELAQKDSFAPGSTETFSLEAADVEEVKRVEVGHDGITPGSGWFLKELDVNLPTKGKHYHFECRQWLAVDKGDGKVSRIFSVEDGKSSITSFKPMVSYEVTVTTGDVADAGTDMKILMTVFGLKGTSSVIEFEKGEDRFERAKTNLIKMEIDDVAPIKKIRLELAGKGSRPCWFLEKLELRNMETGVLSVFKHNGWIGTGKDGAKNPVDIPATERGKAVLDKTSYKVSVKTSDVSGAGTDANVYMIMFGALGDSGELHLKDSNQSKPFKKGQLDSFVFKEILTLGELHKVRVWHDNKGLGAAWHLSQIEVEDQTTNKVYTFICDKWLSTKDDDKQIIRELTCHGTGKPDSARSSGKDKTVFEIEVTTTDKQEGGTIHNGWLVLEGKLGTSKVFRLENNAHNKILRKGTTNNFSMPSKNLGQLQKCIVGAYEREDRPLDDAEGRAAMWHCHEIVVTDTSTGIRYVFPCKQWINIHKNITKSAGQVLTPQKVEETQVSLTRSLAPVKYEVVVVTGDEKGAGTNANVSITIFGSNGNTGKRPLTKPLKNLFEKNQTDKFQLEALDLGELTKVKIEHDNSGFRPAWYLDRVEVVNMATNKISVFPCNKWLAKDKGDGELARELYVKND
ncbi:lipoxygenase homology domain-containing protein 1-like isoform X2 [Physella acuta]|uniref:lipoxygenase homology domain-containing protein 1-like isoform X2 n=1 Tax=Physella acuta TaxID=109671 RepID=UPI0027DCF7EF|nr:lipoxygenase homology domain-containing protein 1-like isoform X2 [Physella acuta]